MQLEVGLIVLLIATSVVHSASLKDSKCGYIDERQFIDQANFAVPTEHQWLARITYLAGDEKKLPDNGCLGVLISKRNVLAPAQCFEQFDGRAEAYSVQLGVWNKSADTHKVSCEEDGFCVLAPQDIELSAIAVHPDFDPVTLTHNLAVITLLLDAKMTPNVMPICMPPPSSLVESLVGQLFVVAGLPIKDPLKHMTWVKTISRPYCQKEHSSLLTSSTTICGYQDKMTTYYLGAPLVGIQVMSDAPHNFYLVGMLLDSKKVKDKERIVSSFLDIRPYLAFINRNAEFLTVNK